jgi:hypothetical protein
MMEHNACTWQEKGESIWRNDEKLADDLVMAIFDTSNTRMTSLNSCPNINQVINNVVSHSFQDVVSM